MFIWLFVVAGLLANYSVAEPDGFDGDQTVTIQFQNTTGLQLGVSSLHPIYSCVLLHQPGVLVSGSTVPKFSTTWNVLKGPTLSASVNWAFNFALAMLVQEPSRTSHGKHTLSFQTSR